MSIATNVANEQKFNLLTEQIEHLRRMLSDVSEKVEKLAKNKKALEDK